jgi:hypothetical protein
MMLAPGRLGRTVRPLHHHHRQGGWVSGKPPTAEDVIDHWGEIVDQDGAVDYPNNIMIFAYENMRLLCGR